MSCAGTESMTYADDELDQIQTDYKMLPGKCDRLFRDYHAAGQRFDVERAREYAHHGFCRRLKTLPLYIPPFVVRSEDMNELNRVGYLASDAVESGDYSGAYNLMDEQRRIGEVVPAVSHSFAEGSRQILFHAQVLADFNTVAKVARRLHSELCG